MEKEEKEKLVRSVSFPELVKIARELEGKPAHSQGADPARFEIRNDEIVHISLSKYREMSYAEALAELRKIDKVQAINAALGSAVGLEREAPQTQTDADARVRPIPFAYKGVGNGMDNAKERGNKLETQEGRQTPPVKTSGEAREEAAAKVVKPEPAEKKEKIEARKTEPIPIEKTAEPFVIPEEREAGLAGQKSAGMEEEKSLAKQVSEFIANKQSYQQERRKPSLFGMVEGEEEKAKTDEVIRPAAEAAQKVEARPPKVEVRVKEADSETERTAKPGQKSESKKEKAGSEPEKKSEQKKGGFGGITGLFKKEAKNEKKNGEEGKPEKRKDKSALDKIDSAKKKQSAAGEESEYEQLEKIGRYWKEQADNKKEDPLERLKKYRKKRREEWDEK